MKPLLEVRDLRVRYRIAAGEQVTALDGANLWMAPGEILGVLGESGSGKSTLASSLLALFAANASVEGGEVLFAGNDLLKMNTLELAGLRGERIAVIFQEPGSALHPTIRAGEQVEEVLRAHSQLTAGDRKRKAQELLREIFQEGADGVYGSYPHQLSGGQRQRVAIAQAIACKAALLVADEPTASLDPVTQEEILDLLGRLRSERNLAILFITHTPELLDGFADRIAVMYAGRIVEAGAAGALLESPLHPYTRGLLQCRPKLDVAAAEGRDARLPIIAGEPPDPSVWVKGCSFELRCSEKMERCSRWKPGNTAVGREQEVACFKFES